MRRREFIAGLGVAAACLPAGGAHRMAAFELSLAGRGWTDGRKIGIDYGWATPDTALRGGRNGHELLLDSERNTSA
jgi:hypothetical protein